MYFRILFISIVIFLCSCHQEQRVRKNNHGVDSFTEILYSDDAVKFIGVYVDLDAKQKVQIQAIADEYAIVLNNMSLEERKKNTARYIIKFLSRSIKEVLTMEQAEKFITENKWVNELFGEE